jgi:hypothetical protein
VSEDIPDAVIINRFRNIISCSSKLPPATAAKWEEMKASRPARMLFRGFGVGSSEVEGFRGLGSKV